MCFGSSSKTSTSAPTNPAIAPAVTNEVNAATSLASQPLQQYQGQLVAPLTDLQNQAIQQIQNAGTLAQPILNQAQSYATQGATPITTTPFSASTVDQYMSPYQSDVINSTQALENQQDAQQQQSLAGNITAAGAWGGDRSAVLQSELAGQQSLANNSSIANLENQGYTQALGQFNTANQLGVQTQQANNQNAQNTAYTLGSLGTSEENSALTAASANLNAGTLQQQVNQENLNVPYEQYLQQQAYPYQQLDFESGILGQAAGTSGTTSTQTSSTPLGSELLGGALSAASFLKSGGRARLATGGSPMAYMPLPAVPTISGYIPTGTSGAGSKGISGGTGDGGGDTGSDNGFKQGQQIGTSLGNLIDPPLSPVSVTPEVTDDGGFLGGTGNSGFLGLSGNGGLFDDIGSFLRDGGRARLADGGTDDDSLPDGPAPNDGMLSLSQTPPDWRGQATNFAPDQEPPAWDDGTPVTTGGGLGHAARVIPPAYTAKPDWRRALLTAGTSMMAANSGNGLQNVGQGLAAGVKEYYDQEDKDNHPEVDHSGPTTTVRYADGTVVDTGIPTEAAINAQATNQYRNANMEATRQAREDAIAQRAAAAQQAAADRENAIEVSRINATNGRFGGMTAGTGIGPDGTPVPGIYTLNERTGQPVFTPGGTLTSKPSSATKTITPDQALAQARKDYANWQAQDKANGGDGTVYNLDKSVSDPTQWITNQATKYLSGGAQASSPSAPPAAPSGAPAASPTAIPSRPPTVPQGSMYSPSRHMWRDSSGRLYTAAGQTAQ